MTWRDISARPYLAGTLRAARTATALVDKLDSDFRIGHLLGHGGVVEEAVLPEVDVRARLAGGSLRTSILTEIGACVTFSVNAHTQRRRGGGGDSTSIECFFSINPQSGPPRGRKVIDNKHSNGDWSMEEEEEEIQRRSSPCSQ